MRTFLSSTAVAAAMALTIGLSATQAEEVQVRYSLWAKPGETAYDGAVEFGRVLEELSDGKFKTKVFPGNQLGTPKELLEQLAMNTTQIAASGDPGMEEIENLALPYLMKDMANYVAVLESDVGRVWNTRLINEANVRLLGIIPKAPRQISANKVIYSLADMEGLKVRVPPRDYYVQSFEAFGAKPTPMAFKEVYVGLQTGVIDGQENPIETIYAQKFFEVQESVAMVDYINKPAWVKISERFWQTLGEEEQGWFLEAQRVSEEYVNARKDEHAKKLLEDFEATGITITYPNREEFRQATQEVRDRLGKQTWGDDLYQRIVEIGRQDL